jgi:glucoamylase
VLGQGQDVRPPSGGPSSGPSLVDAYVSSQAKIAKSGLLANIGPSGSKSAGAKPGIVIASPSTVDPDYLYTWIRDASLVYKVIIDQYTTGEDRSLRGTIDDFVKSQAVLQHMDNPSGTLVTGGLGEPKFNINLTEFTGAWGRPQRDGPALRSTAIITYANWLFDQRNASFVESTLWPVLKLDLDYVQNKWNQSGFDLWEEVNSSSFFTTAAQHRALRQGAVVAERLGHKDIAKNYTIQAENTLCFLQSYWNPAKSYITANTGGGRSGIDANTHLASIHTFDPAAGCDSVTFQPCSDKALSSLKVYVDSFRTIYDINKGIPPTAAVATGRYSEDVYYGGNPWYLTTFGVAEQLYDAIIVWQAQRYIEVTKISQAFFRQFLPNADVKRYRANDPEYRQLIDSIRKFADGFIAVNAKYTPADGGLSEQYARTDGHTLSARDLTWSYASALTVFAAREGKTYSGWGAKGLVVPSVCKANPGPTVTATFNVQATTVPGEHIYLVGSVTSLKDWNPDNGILMDATNYPTWTTTVVLPASSNVEYKYIRKTDGSSGVTWESDPNNLVTTVASGSQVFNDTWR